jgi:intracellular sulfur oxidation DsrE/DsrF family protein
MNGNRKDPELMPPSPEFIKVAYDERGRPIEVTAVDGIDSVQKKEKQAQVTVQRPVIVKSSEQEAMARWIVNLNDHVKVLRDELRLVVVFNQRKFNELQENISTLLEKASLKPSAEILEKFAFINSEIGNLKNQNRLMLENFQTVQAGIKDFTKRIESGTISEKALFEQLNSMEIRLSTFAKEIANTKLHEIETSGILKILVEEIKTAKLSDFETNKRLSDIECQISKSIEEISSTNSYIDSIASHFNQKMSEISSFNGNINEKMDIISLNQEKSFSKISEIEQKLNSFSGIGEEINSLKMQTANSIYQLSEDQDQIKAEILTSQEQISRNVANDTFLKIQKMLAKKKKRPIRPQRAKVVRFLRKNFKIKPFSKVLVISDKKNSVFGKTLYEATRKISKKSVFVNIENRTKKSSLEKPVVEAIKKSTFVFIVGTHSVKKMREISKDLYNVKIMQTNRSLKYLIL